MVTIAGSSATRTSCGIKAKNSAATALTEAAFHMPGVGSRNWVMLKPAEKANADHAISFLTRSRRASFSVVVLVPMTSARRRAAHTASFYRGRRSQTT